MASDETEICTDEELLLELKKLGYSDVSAEAFLMVKKDLSELMLQDRMKKQNSQKYHERYLQKYSRYSNQPLNAVQLAAFPLGRSPTFVVDPRTSPVKYTSSYYIPNSPNKYRSRYVSYKPSQRTQHHGFSEDDPKIASGSSDPNSLNLQKNKYESYEVGRTHRQNYSKENSETVSIPLDSCSPNTVNKYKKQHENYKPISRTQNISEEGDSNYAITSSNSGIQNSFGRNKNNREKTQSQKYSEESKDARSISSPGPQRIVQKDDNSNSKERNTAKSTNQEIVESDGHSSPKKNLEPQRKIQPQNASEVEESGNTECDSPKSNQSPDSTISNMSFGDYREGVKTFKAGRQSPDRKSTSNSVSLEGNKIKRKVLRHKNGKPVVTEEFIEIPIIFNSSATSISSADSSPKTNSSSGSLSAASPDTSDSPRSTDSLSSSRSVLSRISMPRKKKSDPVAMHHFYKKFWSEFKPPGEKKHEKLRWAVRDKMLEYSL